MGKGVCRLNNEQFASLMQQYQRLVYTVCLQFVHDPHTAEDLTQDTFVAAFSAIDRCEPQYYKAWLVRVAANKCKDHLKSAWVRRVQAQQDDALPEPRGAPPGDAADPAEQLASRAGAEELETLVRNRNMVLTRSQLLTDAWGYDYIGASRTVDVHINRVRRKLGLEQDIQTVFKVGYRLNTRGNL